MAIRQLWLEGATSDAPVAALRQGFVDLFFVTPRHRGLVGGLKIT